MRLCEMAKELLNVSAAARISLLPSLQREEGCTFPEVRRINLLALSLCVYHLLLEEYFGPLLLVFMLSSTIASVTWVFYLTWFDVIPLCVKFYNSVPLL